MPRRVARGNAHGAKRHERSLRGQLTGGGTEGNERLTAATGLLLLVLLAALGVTILRIQPLLSEHMFLGVLLIGPVMLKLGSTGYRFVRYYTSEPHYKLKGPPPVLLRVLAPLLIISTLVVFASGVALMLIGPSSRQPLLLVHKASFFVWLALMAVHVLGHLTDLLPALAREEFELAGVENPRPGGGGRALAVGAMLLLGVLLAVLAIPDFGAWTNVHFLHH
jgi:hypothetical protein